MSPFKYACCLREWSQEMLQGWLNAKNHLSLYDSPEEAIYQAYILYDKASYNVWLIFDGSILYSLGSASNYASKT